MDDWKRRGIAVVQYLIVYFLLSIVTEVLALTLGASREGRTGLTLLALLAAIPITLAVRRYRQRHSEAA